MLELAAFFGNPGPEYSGNRHNIGWHLAQKLEQKLAASDQLPWQKKFKGLWAYMDTGALASFCAGVNLASDNGFFPADHPAEPVPAAGAPEKIHFLKPATFMNNSGESAAAAASFFKIKPQNIIVVHDELELPLGTISLKFGGGLGGHNGLRSMKACFGTADFWRLRIGIGRPDDRLPGQGGPPGSGRGIVEWVLSDFTKEEKAALEPVLEKAAGLLMLAFIYGPDRLLPYWAKKRIQDLK
ncbi:MAG: aminoacyl-tRNA hydrolase [Treponema sp.]|nr:aminoacyl-tRNA hydrolase [Treponema sp.]